MSQNWPLGNPGDIPALQQGIFAAVLHKSDTQGGDAMGAFTKLLLRNLRRGTPGAAAHTWDIMDS